MIILVILNYEIGYREIIRQEFEKSGLSASQFARMINKERTLVYHLFKRQSIDTDLLYQICMVLNVDLFSLFSEKLRQENNIIGGMSFPKAECIPVQTKDYAGDRIG